MLTASSVEDGIPISNSGPTKSNTTVSFVHGQREDMEGARYGLTACGIGET